MNARIEEVFKSSNQISTAIQEISEYNKILATTSELLGSEISQFKTDK